MIVPHEVKTSFVMLSLLKKTIRLLYNNQQNNQSLMYTYLKLICKYILKIENIIYN